MSAVKRQTWRGVAAALVVAVAVALRLCNLGTFSMWLDEVSITQRAQGTFAETVSRCVGNAEHPPLSALVMSLGNCLGLSEHGQRLVPVALGIATLLLLMGWVAARFGATAALFVGLLGALSPIHIRYSQELRPYPYLLLFTAAALVATDRLLRRPGLGGGALLALALAGGLYSHLQAPLVLVVALPVLLEAAWSDSVELKTRSRAAFGWFAAAAAAAALLYLPWGLATLGRAVAGADRGGVSSWSWREVGERWQFLTVAAREGDDLAWTGVAVAVLVAVGAVRALASVAGRAAVALVLVATLGIELLLVALNHFSNGRYNLIAWPFLLVLAGLGAERLWQARRLRLAARALVLITLAGHLPVIAEYQTIGRPSWDRFAEVIRLVSRPGEPVLVENEWCAVVLGHYLELDGLATEPRVVETAAQLEAAWPPGRPALVVLGRWPRSNELWQALAPVPWLVEYHNTARLYRVAPGLRARVLAVAAPDRYGKVESDSWPQPTLRLLPERLSGEPRSCFGRAWRTLVPPGRRGRETTRLELDPESTGGRLAGGWSGFEKTPDGVSFAWATGYEAGVELETGEPADRVVRLRWWAYPGLGRPQEVRGLLNGRVLGEAAVSPTATTIEVPVAAQLWRPGRNLLVLQFATCAAPADVNPRSRDPRPLAVAVDWIEVERGSDAR